MLPYEEALKKAQVAANEVKVELSEKELTFPKTKEKNGPGRPKTPKNQLVTIPHKVELSFNGKIREEDLEVDDPVHILMQKFRNGEIDQVDLSVDDRFVMIRHMKDEEGKTQDEIAEELGVTRRTVVNYYKKIKKIKAQALADEDIWEIGGDLYAKGMKAMEDAVAKGKYKEFAYVMTSLVATLQSMGLVFKLPKQSQIQQQISHDLLQKKGQEGFKQLKNMTDNDEINLDSMFSELMDAAKKGVLDKKSVDKK